MLLALPFASIPRSTLLASCTWLKLGALVTIRRAAVVVRPVAQVVSLLGRPRMGYTRGFQWQFPGSG